MFASKAFKALILRKSVLVEGSSSGKIILPIETKKPLSSFQPSLTSASNKKFWANSVAVLFYSINDIELAIFLIRSTSLAKVLDINKPKITVNWQNFNIKNIKTPKIIVINLELLSC